MIHNGPVRKTANLFWIDESFHISTTRCHFLSPEKFARLHSFVMFFWTFKINNKTIQSTNKETTRLAAHRGHSSVLIPNVCFISQLNLRAMRRSDRILRLLRPNTNRWGRYCIEISTKTSQNEWICSQEGEGLAKKSSSYEGQQHCSDQIAENRARYADTRWRLKSTEGHQMLDLRLIR